jgi:serine/threonine-protein kinase RsbT
LSQPLLERQPQSDNEVTIRVKGDADVVRARKSARELAAKLGFSRIELTLIATAVSEITRNIVRFAGNGEVHIELVDEPRPGIRIVARDTGPGIADVDQAVSDGYSTYDGLGLGLPGARRLMDQFSITSEIKVGTTVTMTKWRTGG